MAANTSFATVYPEANPESIDRPEKVRKVIICNGQIYYALHKQRETLKDKSVAIVRMEQFCPFPYAELEKELGKYSDAEFVWVQENHKNYGGWYFVRQRLPFVLEELKKQRKIKNDQLLYCGRKMAGGPAIGSSKIHNKEEQELLKAAFE